jgi:hypothetical protein
MAAPETETGRTRVAATMKMVVVLTATKQKLAAAKNEELSCDSDPAVPKQKKGKRTAHKNCKNRFFY